jgi:hypothetical protein
VTAIAGLLGEPVIFIKPRYQYIDDGLCVTLVAMRKQKYLKSRTYELQKVVEVRPFEYIEFRIGTFKPFNLVVEKKIGGVNQSQVEVENKRLFGAGGRKTIVLRVFAAK